MSRSEKILTIVLRVGGILVCTAFIFMAMPMDWMVAIHAWLGLGKMPRDPIVEYLARSTSALYGYQGVLALIISTNLRRFRPVLLFSGWMAVSFGCAQFVYDRTAGMPDYWARWEGPMNVLMGTVILLLSRGVPHFRSS